MTGEMARKLVAVICTVLPGCATPLPPVVEKSLRCEIPASMLEPCPQPAKIEDEITYARILEIAAEDRANLRKCALRQESLASAATLCQMEVAKHNQNVEDANARNAGKK